MASWPTDCGRYDYRRNDMESNYLLAVKWKWSTPVKILCPERPKQIKNFNQWKGCFNGGSLSRRSPNWNSFNSFWKLFSDVYSKATQCCQCLTGIIPSEQFGKPEVGYDRFEEISRHIHPKSTEIKRPSSLWTQARWLSRLERQQTWNRSYKTVLGWRQGQLFCKEILIDKPLIFTNLTQKFNKFYLGSEGALENLIGRWLW